MIRISITTNDVIIKETTMECREKKLQQETLV